MPVIRELVDADGDEDLHLAAELLGLAKRHAIIDPAARTEGTNDPKDRWPCGLRIIGADRLASQIADAVENFA